MQEKIIPFIQARKAVTVMGWFSILEGFKALTKDGKFYIYRTSNGLYKQQFA